MVSEVWPQSAASFHPSEEFYFNWESSLSQLKFTLLRPWDCRLAKEELSTSLACYLPNQPLCSSLEGAVQEQFVLWCISTRPLDSNTFILIMIHFTGELWICFCPHSAAIDKLCSILTPIPNSYNPFPALGSEALLVQRGPYICPHKK